MIFNINMLRQLKNLTIKINNDTDLVIKGSTDGQSIEITTVSTNIYEDDSSTPLITSSQPPIHYPPHVK